MKSYHAWNVYWTTWAVVTFLLFIAPEIFGLLTDSNRTLSAAVWRMETFNRNQSVLQWTFVHFAFVAMLGFLLVWLVGHFGFGIWR